MAGDARARSGRGGALTALDERAVHDPARHDVGGDQGRHRALELRHDVGIHFDACQKKRNWKRFKEMKRKRKKKPLASETRAARNRKTNNERNAFITNATPKTTTRT